MSRIVILGAGELGGALAYSLARRDRVGEIRLIDPAGDVAAGKALDIRQSGPVEGFDAQVTASHDVSHVVSADLIVIADPVAGSTEDGHAWGAELLTRIAPLVPRVAVIAAGAAHADLVGRNGRERLLPRLRVLGSAPEALAAAVRAMVALETNASPEEVALTVTGLPPAGFVVGWSEATIGGAAIGRVVPPPTLRRLAARVTPLWPPGPAALASAAARVVETMVTGSRRQATCFIALDGELGQRSGVSALPVRLGSRGVESVSAPALSAQERTQLENILTPRPA